MTNENQTTMVLPKSPLPDFDSPPVTEVVLGIQFEPIPNLTAPILGLYWGSIRHRFPKVQQQPPLAQTFERTGTRQIVPIMMPIQFTLPVGTPRLWFLDAQENEMIQVQQDRFIRNWRKLVPEDIYPRYNNRIFPQFRSDFESFKSFLESENIPAPKSNQCEINYVNQIVAGEGWQTHADISQVFNLVTNERIESDTLSFEDGRFYFRYEIKHDGIFVGRLHVVVEPGFDNNSKPIFTANLSARGKPLSDDDQGALDFLNLGHELIVRTFAAITTPMMHEIWRRTDDKRKSRVVS